MPKGADTVTTVCLRSCPDYLPRVRRIAACLAESAGMFGDEADDTRLVLNEACVNAIRHGSSSESDQVLITFRTSTSEITADVTDRGGPGSPPEPIGQGKPGLGISLMRMLADQVQFIGHSNGTTVRLTKRPRRIVSRSEAY